jgi:hypothetical protein
MKRYSSHASTSTKASGPSHEAVPGTATPPFMPKRPAIAVTGSRMVEKMVSRYRISTAVESWLLLPGPAFRVGILRLDMDPELALLRTPALDAWPAQRGCAAALSVQRNRAPEASELALDVG